MDKLNKTLKIVLIILVCLGIAYMSVSLYDKWEKAQELEGEPRMEYPGR